MRIALVSPYSWTYPGGVTRHIEALAEQLGAAGHHVRVLSAYDPDDRHAALAHRGARPQRRPAPDYLIPLGRTVGLPANGAVSNVALGANALARMRHELRAGAFDVVHVHEPVVPVLAADAVMSTRAPLVGTFHAYSTKRLANNVANVLGARSAFNHLHVRIAVSEAAAWTNRRFFGGHYRVVPNGVHLGEAPAPSVPGDRLRIVFVGQAVERKGLPVLLRAFEALRDHIPAELTIVGASSDDVAQVLEDRRGITALGKVDDDRKRLELERADVLCAPSLGGESFGMVLTEAFAAGTPVVASDIAGYRDVVDDGHDGTLVRAGDALHVAEALRDLWHEPDHRLALAAAARESAASFAWPRVAEQVLDAYGDAIATPEPATRLGRAAVRVGARAADLRPREPARRLPSLEPAPVGHHRPLVALARRLATIVALAGGVALAVLALHKIGIHNIFSSLIDSSPTWVLVGLGVMCSSMVARAVSWQAVLRAALPNSRIRLRDAMQGVFIGVLMSATLPARLGEPSRALVLARRTGRPRENLPVVLGTVLAQTLVNLLALAILGGITFATVDLFHGHEQALLVAVLAPMTAIGVLLVAPAVLRRGAASRQTRLHRMLARARRALHRARAGLVVFRRPRLGAVATLAQLGAWGLQLLSCYLLMVALGLGPHASIGAAAAVLFAVNVTAAIPVTPSNLGVFQAACVAVLAGAYGVSPGRALAYGIILQAVEIATAVMMGMPALVKEGLSWKDVRMRALHAAPIELKPWVPRTRRGREGLGQPS